MAFFPTPTGKLTPELERLQGRFPRKEIRNKASRVLSKITQPIIEKTRDVVASISPSRKATVDNTEEQESQKVFKNLLFSKKGLNIKSLPEQALSGTKKSQQAQVQKGQETRTNKTKSIVKAIGDYETESLQLADGSFIKPKSIGETYSYVHPFSRDLGRYQVSPPTLETYSKLYLGRQVTVEEFLENPELQDKFVEKMISDRKDRFGLTDEEVIKAHNVGLNGDFDSSIAKEYLERVSEFLKEDSQFSMLGIRPGVKRKAESRLRSAIEV